jgi:hypothetical protein
VEVYIITRLPSQLKEKGEHQKLQITTSYTAKMCTSHILKIKQNIQNMYIRHCSLPRHRKKKDVTVSLVHAMEAHMVRLGKVPLIFNLDTRERWTVNSICSSCTPRKEPQYLINTRLGVAHRAGWPIWVREKSLSLTRFQTLDYPACNPVTIPSKPSSSPPTSSANN